MITLTQKAIQAIKRAYDDAQLPLNTTARIAMKAGGCSGFDVSMEPDLNKPTKFDLTFVQEGVMIVIDKKSHTFLDGMEVDFVTKGFDGGFKFNPPGATASCGCGTSFAFAPNEHKKESKPLTFELSL